MTTRKRNIKIFRRLRRKVDTLLMSLLVATTLTVLPSSCRKFIEVDPPFTGMNGDNVYTSDETAAAVLTDIYALMSAENTTLTGNNITSISLYISLTADELALHDLNNQDLLEYYRNNLNKTSQHSYWSSIFSQILSTNNAIEGLTHSTGLSISVRQQLLGEARFARAFFYFYLVNMYGDIPLVLTSNHKINSLLSRSPITAVYQQIINDLKEAQILLSESYVKGDAKTMYASGEEERVRPTKWAATALLARTYLYIGDYMNAEAAATLLINQAGLYTLTELNETFLKNSKEAIWQLQPVGTDEQANTGEGRLFVLPPTGPDFNHPAYLNGALLNSFETGDLRKSNWIDSVTVGSAVYYYPYKYKIGNESSATLEYPTILRLAEQYLIRAEARAARNDITGSQNDLNSLRRRAGLPDTDATDKTALLNAIYRERQRELFTEWGHRWFDLKRSGHLDKVMNVITPEKGGTWHPYQSLFPIPQTDINKAPNLSQNPGYN